VGGANLAELARPRFVVGLGASAGGLEALEAFLRAAPSNTGMAFVIVQHLSPDHKSHMVELLAKHTTMSVVAAQDGVSEPVNEFETPA
jgi:two-component system CheB/CheR fusion protein